MANVKTRTATHGRNHTPSARDRPTPAGPGGSERPAKTARGEIAGMVSATERAIMIAQAAYLHAERRGFAAGHELDDWLAAEREVNHLLGPPGPPASETEP